MDTLVGFGDMCFSISDSQKGEQAYETVYVVISHHLPFIKIWFIIHMKQPPKK